MPEIQQVKLDSITVGKYAVRISADDTELDDLCSSIRRVGVVVPLVLHQVGDTLNLLCGHRRYVAAKRIGLSSVPSIIRTDTEGAAAELGFAENIFRKNLSPIEQAAAIQDVLKSEVMDIEQVAAVMHRSVHWVQRQLAILAWPGDIQKAVHDGQISVSSASNLALVSDPDYRAFLLRNAVEQGATARTTAAWLQAWRACKSPEQAIHTPPVQPGERITAPIPQAACIVCNRLNRTDGLAHVLVCTACLAQIRDAGEQG